MKTVPLYGVKAAGRVALVDDEDYDLAMMFRWNVWEYRRPNGVTDGPYARTCLRQRGKKVGLALHKLITGYPQTDHINHDTLDDRRSNLRPVTTEQNIANQRARARGTSQYKGVWWNTERRQWESAIKSRRAGRVRGLFADEVAAARAYDEAASAAWGEYACLNFPLESSPLVEQRKRAEERAAYEAERVAFVAEVKAFASTSKEEWWARRVPRAVICQECGREFQARSTRPPLRCSGACHARAARRRKREEREANRATR